MAHLMQASEYSTKGSKSCPLFAFLPATSFDRTAFPWGVPASPGAVLGSPWKWSPSSLVVAGLVQSRVRTNYYSGGIWSFFLVSSLLSHHAPCSVLKGTATCQNRVLLERWKHPRGLKRNTVSAFHWAVSGGDIGDLPPSHGTQTIVPLELRYPLTLGDPDVCTCQGSLSPSHANNLVHSWGRWYLGMEQRKKTWLFGF